MGRDSTKISFVGLGYVGLCTATVFATKGIHVTGIDIDSERIKKLTSGEAPFHEPGLAPILKTVIKKKTLDFTTDIQSVADSSTTFVTVGTPSNEDGSINLAYVKKATEEIGSAIKNKNDYHLTVVKSTVVPGTASRVVKPILESSSGKNLGGNLGLCSNPEFLAEGAAIKGTLKPDKIVIGAADQKSEGALSKLYRHVYSGKKIPTIVTNTTTAETIKYASNTFLATRVSTINTIANVCQRLPQADVETVSRALGLDPRIGPLYLKAGPGYGGSCFHKDLQALIAFSHTIDYDPVLLSAVEEVNQRQAQEVLKLCEKLLGSLADRRISVLGLSFKKDTDDVREAASLRVIDQLVKKNAKVTAYDPMAIETARKVLSGTVEFARDYRSCLTGSDCCVLMTEWDEFRRLKPAILKSIMKTPNIVDARRVLNRDEFREFNYLAVGLGAPTS